MKLNFATRASLLMAACISISAYAADARKEAKIDIAAGGTVNIVNGGGSVALHSGPGHQLLVSYIVHSAKVEVDQNTSAHQQRVELVTHALPGEKPTADEAKVDYDVTVPAGVSVNVSTTSAPITADGVNSEIGLSSETGQITLHNIAKSHVHIRSMTAPVTLQDVTMTRVDIQSAGGNVQLTNVNGQRVTVGTTSGNIGYQGDCSGGGDYILTTHSGAIDVTLPATASVDLTARSTTGAVENAFPLQQKSHNSFVPQQGRSFAGTSNSGSSSVELQSFSGKIRVKKQ
ncbi:MAG TPA: DUF4097 family beta strand repeat-containing protein [Candidatus Angelobacter sp.]|jgi:DUF4097 and DUF4098 domain-containing protein YvlB|nr:DUF4097 family beta strand repeat-containing protein [Candidatus Angelobacter sp.]